MKKKILLVEDQVLIAMDEQRILENCGFEVLTALSGQEAVTAVQNHTDINLILMDIDLGSGINGIEAATLILQQHELPIVFLTSHSEKAYVEKVEQVTSYGLITKHSGEFVLIQSIKMALKLFEAHTRLQQSEHETRTLVENLNSGIVKVTAQGKISFFSKGAERLFGYSAEEILDQSIFATILPQRESSGRNLKELLQQVLLQPEQFKYLEHENLHKNGSRIWVAWRNTPVYDNHGNLLHILSIADDISLHKKAEEALRESEQKFRQLFMQHTAPKLIIDPLQDGRIVDANWAASEFYGFSREELCGMSTSDIHIMPVNKRIEAWFEPDTHKRQSKFSTRHRTVDGTVKDVEVYASPITIRNQELLYAIITDISDTRIFARALQERNKKYRLITENSADIIVQVDAQLNPLYISPSATKTLGYTLADFTDATILDAVPAYDRPKLEAAIAEALQHKARNLTHTHRVISKSGSLRWFETRATLSYDENGNFSGASYVDRDITEQKNTEEALRRSEELHRGILEASPNGIIQTDLQGNILFINNEYIHMYGAESKQQIIGRNVCDFLPAAQMETARKNLKKTLEQGSVHRIQYKTYKLDGSLFDVELSAATMCDTDGTPVGFIGITHDITEFKQKEAEVEQLLHEKEQLLREVHHRIKNHMNTLYSIFSLNAHYYDSPEISAVFDEVRTKIRLMQSIYDTLYRGEQVDSVQLVPFLHPLIEELQAAYVYAQDITMHKDIQDVVVTAKQSLPIGIIINELLTNALKHAFNDRPAGRIHVSVYQPDARRLAIEVADDGQGMPDNMLAESSYGFGLTLVQGYARQYDGRMLISTNNGTTVQVLMDLE